MTNKQKAKELAKQLLADDQNQQPLIDVLMQMAQWKDEHPSQELKRQIVNKAVKWLESNRHIKDDVVWHLYIDSFKRSMIEEQ